MKDDDDDTNETGIPVGSVEAKVSLCEAIKIHNTNALLQYMGNALTNGQPGADAVTDNLKAILVMVDRRLISCLTP